MTGNRYFKGYVKSPYSNFLFVCLLFHFILFPQLLSESDDRKELVQHSRDAHVSVESTGGYVN